MSEPRVTPPPPPTVPNNRSILLVLAYLFPLSIIPLLTEKDDREVQWHAKHGIVLGLLFSAVWVVLTIVGSLTFGMAWLLSPLVGLAILVIIVFAIVKALQGERFKLPGISDLADRF